MTRNGRNGNGKRNGNGGQPLLNHRRRRRMRRRRERTATRRFTLVLVLGIVVGGLAALAAAAFTAASAFKNSCDLGSLKPVAIGQNSFVYAADGSLLGAIPAERNRQPVTLPEMAAWVPRATIAIEDRRFYQHGGLDYEAIIRAAVKNLEEGAIVQGGSTITQQLVRNLYIGRERSVERKAKEACLALKLEDVHNKQWILQTYLNQVYFGNHAYGVEAASSSWKRPSWPACRRRRPPTTRSSVRTKPCGDATTFSAPCSPRATSTRPRTRRPWSSRSSFAPDSCIRRSASRISSATCVSS